jgi:hypothetical protein
LTESLVQRAHGREHFVDRHGAFGAARLACSAGLSRTADLSDARRRMAPFDSGSRSGWCATSKDEENGKMVAT